MSNPTPEIKYPITPNELIDYLNTNSAAYPVYLGSDFVLFSAEPYTGKRGVFPDKKTFCKSIYKKSIIQR